jgi:hypothetical protein
MMHLHLANCFCVWELDLMLFTNKIIKDFSHKNLIKKIQKLQEILVITRKSIRDADLLYVRCVICQQHPQITTTLCISNNRHLFADDDRRNTNAIGCCQ